MNLIDVLETQVDWNSVFGVVEDLYYDPGFTSRADNFIVSSSVELALEAFSPLMRVDKIGFDFIHKDSDASDIEMTLVGDVRGEAVELKMRKNLFYSPRGKFARCTQAVKMKNFQGDKKTLEDFKNHKTFNKLIILDLTYFRILVIEDEVARSRYYEDGDGVFAKFQPGDYYMCDIPEVKPVRSAILLSEVLQKTKAEWIQDR